MMCFAVLAIFLKQKQLLYDCGFNRKHFLVFLEETQDNNNATPHDTRSLMCKYTKSFRLYSIYKMEILFFKTWLLRQM